MNSCGPCNQRVQPYQGFNNVNNNNNINNNNRRCDRRNGPVYVPFPFPFPGQVAEYFSTAIAATAVPSGGAALTTATTIAPGSTTVPAGTVTVLTAYTPAVANGIGLINGFFTIVTPDVYDINAAIGFTSSGVGNSAGDFRAITIYAVDSAVATGNVRILATVNSVPIDIGAAAPTNLNVATRARLNAGDRVFIAVRQVTAAGAPTINTNGTSRVTISRA